MWYQSDMNVSPYSMRDMNKIDSQRKIEGAIDLKSWFYVTSITIENRWDQTKNLVRHFENAKVTNTQKQQNYDPPIVSCDCIETYLMLGFYLQIGFTTF